MLHFEVTTNINKNIFDEICVSKKQTNISNLNFSCQKSLAQIKRDIESNSKPWDVFKKYTYPYEYLHTSVDGIYLSKYKPFSRAFYKMIELIHFFQLFHNKKNESITSYHFAEGPGGFIEATEYYRNSNNNKYMSIDDEYNAVTLIDEYDNSIPGWKKSKQFFKNKDNIHLNIGFTNDGNMYKVKNLDYIFENHRNSHDIVTCDGGFDFSLDFNNQESIALKLIICEMLYGIISTKLHGNFILKVFDMFTTCSYEIVYMLSKIFEEVYICKPNTSRFGNSEKYIVCKHKKFEIDDDMFDKIKRFFIQINIYEGDFKDLSFLTFKLPYQFMNQLTEYNTMFAERQIENINATLSLIINNKKVDMIDKLKNKHINLCIQWLKFHNIQFNSYKKGNLFLSYK